MYVDILRVENGEGRGPYNAHHGAACGSADYTAARQALDIVGDTDMPAPWDPTLEPVLAIKWTQLSHTYLKTFRFGFEDQPQLDKTWGPEVLKALALLGFKVSTYRVPRRFVIFGVYQVAYRTCNAEKIT